MRAKEDIDIAALRCLIGEVRKTFRLLAGISDRMLESRGLTASLRAVLEYLAEEGPSPVPKMAEAKSMKRQSVQALVDRLSDRGFVETRANPEHKRSVLIALTADGTAEFQAILAEEADLLKSLSGDWEEESVAQACGTLTDFRQRLMNAGRVEDEGNLEKQNGSGNRN